MSTPAISSIHHVTLSVSDPDAGIAWYRDPDNIALEFYTIQ